MKDYTEIWQMKDSTRNKHKSIQIMASKQKYKCASCGYECDRSAFVTLCLQRTPQIEGHTIREYKSVVTGETIIGANVID